MNIERVGQLDIRRVRGLSQLCISFGEQARIVVLSGANGTGKTSTCTALSLLLNGPKFDDGSDPFHDAAYICEVEAKLRGAEVAWTRLVSVSKGAPHLADVRDEVTDSRVSAQAASIRRRASVFFQGDLEIDLDPLLEILLTDVPEISALRSDLRHAASRLDLARSHEFPSRATDDPKQLENLRKAARDRLVEAWADLETALAPLGLESPRRDLAAELKLNNGNLPKQWRSRLQAVVMDLGDVVGQPLSLGAGVSTSDVLTALEQTLEAGARLGPAAATVIRPIHLDRAIVDQRLQVRCVGLGSEDDLSGDVYELPVDEFGLARVTSHVDAVAAKIAAARTDLGAHIATSGWPVGTRASLSDVLSALITDGPRWGSPANAADAPLLQPTTDWVKATLEHAEAAQSALQMWASSIAVERTRLERTLFDLELRLGTMRALFVAGQRLVSESGWKDTLDALPPGRHIDAVELQDLLAAKLPPGGPRHRPLERPIEAARAWRSVELRCEAHERAEADDRSRAAALPILNDAIKALQELAPEKGSGALDRAAGVDPRALEGLVAVVNRISRHHFRASHVEWKLVQERRGIRMAAQVGPRSPAIPVNATSTGEQTIAGLSLTIALNLLLEKQIGHRVLIFDDFTTAFDLAQLPAVALLLRKLAWNAARPRQLVLSTHHEEVTNRLLELLAPPPGETVRVVQFQPAEVNAKPETPRVELFDGTGSDAHQDQDRVDTLFATTLRAGLAYLYREPEEASAESRPESSGATG